MATSTAQRVSIWIIAIVMLIGSVGVFVGVILANNNQSDTATSEADTQKQMEEYKKQMEEQAKASAAASQPLDGYSAAPFDASAVTALQTEDLKPGTGKEAAANSTLSVNYFGWTPDGKIFDSSNKNGTVTPAEFPLDKVIQGWTQGLQGAKEGGVRKLVIPASLAYGAQGSPPTIQPNTPLTFIVEIKKVQ